MKNAIIFALCGMLFYGATVAVTSVDTIVLGGQSMGQIQKDIQKYAREGYRVEFAVAQSVTNSATNANTVKGDVLVVMER